MALEFSKCCCCIELKTGCLIIGYINLICEIVLTLILSLALAATGVITATGEDVNTQTAGALGMIITGIVLFFIIIFMAFTIVLLVGIHKHKRGHVAAYLVYAVIFSVIYIINFAASFASADINPGNVVMNIIFILLNIYYILVIRSYHLKMNDGGNNGAVFNKA